MSAMHPNAGRTYQPIPTGQVSGAIFYARYAGGHRSPRLPSLEAAMAFDTLECPDPAGRPNTVELLGFAAGTADRLYIWDSYQHCWIDSPYRLYEVGPAVPPAGPREVSREEFDAIRSMGIEDAT